MQKNDQFGDTYGCTSDECFDDAFLLDCFLNLEHGVSSLYDFDTWNIWSEVLRAFQEPLSREFEHATSRHAI